MVSSSRKIAATYAYDWEYLANNPDSATQNSSFTVETTSTWALTTGTSTTAGASVKAGASYSFVSAEVSGKLDFTTSQSFSSSDCKKISQTVFIPPGKYLWQLIDRYSLSNGQELKSKSSLYALTDSATTKPSQPVMQKPSGEFELPDDTRNLKGTIKVRILNGKGDVIRESLRNWLPKFLSEIGDGSITPYTGVYENMPNNSSTGFDWYGSTEFTINLTKAESGILKTSGAGGLHSVLKTKLYDRARSHCDWLNGQHKDFWSPASPCEMVEAILENA